MPGLDLAAPNAGGDELDDLFNYDIDVDEAFRDIEQQAKAQTKSGQAGQEKSDNLGINEEVQVKKARQPIAKLDEKRLLSERGIPKLRRITKDKLRFKGKGHEFSDVARMLSLYQLWLDDLYPRAKFLDSLAMVEKLGHAKSIQIMRKNWIDESKPRDPQLDLEIEALATEGANGSNTPTAIAETGLPQVAGETNGGEGTRRTERESDPDNLFLSDEEGTSANAAPDEDELDALLAEDSAAQHVRHRAPTQSLTSNVLDPIPPADDLDALLAEQEVETEKRRTTKTAKSPSTGDRPVPTHDDFADEMEAMDDIDMW